MSTTTWTRLNGSTIAVIALLTTLALALAGCGVSEQAEGADGFVPTVADPTATSGTPLAVVVVDSSASVLDDTDLIAAAQNRVTQLIEQMPVGGKVVVKALNNMTANCVDLTFELPQAQNSTVLDETRQANVKSVPGTFAAYLDCVTAADRGGTQLFGLLAETAAFYGQAQLWDVYSDGLDNYNLKGLKRGRALSDPNYPAAAVATLPPALVPPLTTDTVVTWHALGRGTDLDAVALGGLRQVYLLWTTATGASARFAPN